ncbi:MAG: hypothetical protein IKI81_04635 [Selenomonadaceae bacterium]|nr:hypothetical protein [Selenomonadaceae bacterium]
MVLHAENADGNSVEFTAGNTNGYVLEVSCPVGSQEMADAIYASLALRGATYQSFQAESVHIDPAFELGDSLTANSTDAVIWATKMPYGRLMAPALGAPLEEEIDHEAPYKTKQEREFSREKEYTRAQLAITATQISAKVSKTGGDPSSFGWVLTDHDWTLTSNNSTVLKATSAGLEVSGHITATSGTIGGVTIRNGVLSGITSTNIAVGGITGGEGGSIESAGLTTWNMAGGINTNLNYGAAYGLATTQGSGSYPNVFNCNNLVHHGRFMSVGGSVCQLLTKTIDGVTITYLGNA